MRSVLPALAIATGFTLVSLVLGYVIHLIVSHF